MHSSRRFSRSAASFFMASMSLWPLHLYFGQVRQGVIHAHLRLAQAGHVLGRLRHAFSKRMTRVLSVSGIFSPAV